MFIPDKFICGQKGTIDNNILTIVPLAYLTYIKLNGEYSCKKKYDAWLSKELDDNKSEIISTHKETEFNNIPMSGIELIKIIGSPEGKTNKQHDCIIIRDPRGFELEVSYENFLDICKTTGISKGKLSGSFVYGFISRGRVYLINTESEYYEICINESKQYLEDYSDTNNIPSFSLKDMKKGYIYNVNRNGVNDIEAIYIGKTPVYHYPEGFKIEHLFLLLNVSNNKTKHTIEILHNVNIVSEQSKSSLSEGKCDEIINNIGECALSMITYDIVNNISKRTDIQNEYILDILNREL